MTTIENIAILQRIAGTLKTDISNGDKEKALSKMEILEGELNLFRRIEEEKESAKMTIKQNDKESDFVPSEEAIDSEATIVETD
jgi:hypothetical protein